MRPASSVFWCVTGALVIAACSDAADFGNRRENEGAQSLDLALLDAGADAAATSSSNSSPEPMPSVDEIGDLFEEEHCPEVVQRIESVECDPLAETEPGRVSDCGEYEGCYPYVEYPSAPCEPETFGTRCDLAGAGGQGEPCSGSRCAPGFLCVVTGRGTECAELCRLPGANTCADGFICGSLDIDGFGVCI